jgi:hypothetical protein
MAQDRLSRHDRMGYTTALLVAVEEAELEPEGEREGYESHEDRYGWKGGTHGFSLVLGRQDVKRPKRT